MLQGPNKFKNHRLRWLLKPLRLTKFDSLWIQAYSLVAASRSWTVFSLSSLFLNSNKVFPKYLFPLIYCCWMNFTIGCPSFYSAILGLLGYHRFPLFAALGTITNVVTATSVAGPFLIFSLFPSFEVPFSKTPSWLFRSEGGPKGLTFDLSFSKTSRFYLFKPTFWLLSFLSFFLNGTISFYQAERSPATFIHGPSS